ncbi:MAG: TolC family protein [Treponema sp.]|nr:TolC family protein [Treponema sp.]
MENDADIQQGKITLDQTKRESSHSVNSFLPSIAAEGIIAKAGDLNDKDSQENVYQSKIGAFASLTIDLGVPAKIKALKKQYQAQQITYDYLMRQVTSAVKKGFYAVICKKMIYDAYRDYQSSSEKTLNDSKVKHNNGMIPETDLLMAQYDAEDAKIQTSNARLDYTSSLTTFLSTIGITDNEVYELQGNIEDAVPTEEFGEETVSKVFSASTEIAVLEKKLEAARAAKWKAVGQGWLPSVTLSGGIYPFGYRKFDNDLLDSQAKNKIQPWSVTAMVRIPLDAWLPLSSTHDAISTVSDSVKSLEIQLADTKRKLRADTKNLIDKINLTKEVVVSRRNTIDIAKRRYELTDGAFQRGSKTATDLQNARVDYEAVRVYYYQEQYNLISDVLTLKEKYTEN